MKTATDNIRRLFAAALLCLLVAVISGCAAGGAAPEMPVFEIRSGELNRRGVDAFRRGELERAERMFAASLAVNRSVDNRRGEALDLINLGRVYTAMGRFKEADSVLGDAAALAGALDDGGLAGEVHATLAKAAFLSGNLEKALQHIEESLKTDGALGYKGEGGRLTLKALILIETGRPGEASGPLARSLDLARSDGDRAGEANALRAMALVEAAAGRTTPAIELFEAAYEIDAASGSTGKVAYGLERMAGLHRRAGRPGKAAFLLERAYRVNLSGGFSERAAEDLSTLIETCTEMGDGAGAARWSEVRDRIRKTARPR